MSPFAAGPALEELALQRLHPIHAPVPPASRGRRGGRFGRLLLRVLAFAALAAATLLGAAETGAADITSGDRLVDLYLYNFLLFVDWPEESFSNRHAIAIGLLDNGTDPGQGLLESIEGKQIRGRTLEIHRVERIKDVDLGWQVLFVRDVPKAAAHQALARIKNEPCLTVSGNPAFVELGGMVALLHPYTGPEAGRSTARFRINLDAVLEAGLKIRSRLLRLSEITGDIPNGTTSNP